MLRAMGQRLCSHEAVGCLAGELPRRPRGCSQPQRRLRWRDLLHYASVTGALLVWPLASAEVELYDVGRAADLAAGLGQSCDTEEWRYFKQLTDTYCLAAAPWYCMHHPFFVDTSWDLLATGITDSRAFCLNGIGAASIIFQRDLEHRGDGAVMVDLAKDEGDEPRVLLSFGRGGARVFRFPMDYSFAPFPYFARDLLPYRVRSAESMVYLCRLVADLFSDINQVWLPWLGFLRFWAEYGHSDFRDQSGSISVDLLLPAEAEEILLSLDARLHEDRKQDLSRGLYMYEVQRHRLVQISLNHLPELGDGMDVRHVCPSCSVVNIYFMSKDGTLTTEAPPCRLAQADLPGLEEFRDFTTWDKTDGMMPETVLVLLANHGQAYFNGLGVERPCGITAADFEPAAAAGHLGILSRKLLADYAPVDETIPEAATAGGYMHYDESFRSVDSLDDERRRLVVPCMDFSEQIRGLYGAAGWFAFIEAKMTAKRPALTVFQTKTFMKKLMAERGVPIPRLIYASMESPALPFGPPLPRMPGGYVVKPAHLAESSNVFVIDEEGVDLLTGVEASWEAVQNNMTYAWSRSLGDYDKAGSNVQEQQCARSKRYGSYIEGRSCTNWALYRSPPGILIEQMVQPSMPYSALQETAFKQQDLDIQWRRQPDEIKCHVVWGKVAFAEWVSTPAFLGFIFRHGYLKDNILLGPRTLQLCDDGMFCEFGALWAYVVAVAEAAVPPGVDYLRVDIFPNGATPVVNELSVAGYATLLEEWMLAEMMRRVKEGYLWRGFNISDPDPK